MSLKTIKPRPVGLPQNLPPVPEELRGVPDDLLLEQERGRDNYEKALGCLIGRFANSSYCRPNLLTGKPGQNPEDLVLHNVHLLVQYFDKVFPRTQDDRPISVPELAVMMGAVIGTAAASAYADKNADLETIEAQVEVAWIALREWLPRMVCVINLSRARGVVPEGQR
jgi:hypothetical protein